MAAPINPTSAMRQCQSCGSMKMTSPVTFHRNIGMLVMRRTIRLEGNLCKSCIGKKYWEFMGKNLILGPWGMISLIVTPIYLITNTVSYVSASRNLRGAVE